jgi:cytochrome c biogenesis protein
VGGLQALSDFMEGNVPEAERERAGEVLLRILNGTCSSCCSSAASVPACRPCRATSTSSTFMTQAVLALSDAFFYPAPVTFQLTDFEQVQASVFQVARAPGQEPWSTWAARC